MKNLITTLFFLSISSLLHAAETLTADNLFDPDRLIQVEVTMDPKNWLDLRISHRETGENFSQIVEKPYEYYPADVKIDGLDIGRVGIRKKGFFGSAVSTRPSLKLKIDYSEKNRTFAGQDRLTFNNNNQDPTRAQSFLVYQFMNEAGVMSPRSNLARITVNGEDLGIYTHVESVRKPFIKRLFGKSKGDLWEGFAGDFTESEYGRIVHKFGKDDDGVELQRLYALLQSPDPIPLDSFEKLLDIDAFITLWASEVLIGHWDGYAGNRNNFYIFRPKKSGLFYFTPWGPDSAFADPGPFIHVPVPKSIKARGYLCERLWELPEVRERYRKEMQRLLNEVWDEKKMLTQLQQVRAMTKPYSTVPDSAVEKGAQSIVNFIESRRGEVQAELDAPATDWPDLGAKFKPGAGKAMVVKGTFNGVFTEPGEDDASGGDSALFASIPDDLLGTGKASITYIIEDETYEPFTQYGVRTTPGNPDFIRKDYPVIELIASSDSGHPPWRLLLILDPYQVAGGKNQLDIDHFTVWAQLTQGEPGSDAAQTTAFGISGSLELDEFSRQPGAPVSGRFELNMGTFKEASH
ncbi:MAG: CotH kinase family protein [Xanthomonadales bacterium]|nr:CotH kinase family protein [Xanthomonadales bacterium]